MNCSSNPALALCLSPQGKVVGTCLFPRNSGRLSNKEREDIACKNIKGIFDVKGNSKCIKP